MGAKGAGMNLPPNQAPLAPTPTLPQRGGSHAGTFFFLFFFLFPLEALYE